jgi:preprotein translocase subunit SecG
MARAQMQGLHLVLAQPVQVFGARGAHSFLYKLTAVLAIGFFVTSISLAYFASNERVAADPEQSIMTQSVMSDDGFDSDTSEIPSN